MKIQFTTLFSTYNKPFKHTQTSPSNFANSPVNQRPQIRKLKSIARAALPSSSYGPRHIYIASRRYAQRAVSEVRTARPITEAVGKSSRWKSPFGFFPGDLLRLTDLRLISIRCESCCLVVLFRLERALL